MGVEGEEREREVTADVSLANITIGMCDFWRVRGGGCKAEVFLACFVCCVYRPRLLEWSLRTSLAAAGAQVQQDINSGESMCYILHAAGCFAFPPFPPFLSSYNLANLALSAIRYGQSRLVTPSAPSSAPRLSSASRYTSHPTSGLDLSDTTFAIVGARAFSRQADKGDER